MSVYYKEYSRFYLAVDSIIFGFDKENLRLLLIKRNFEPCKGKWSLMGGFLDPEESLDEAAGRILLQLTGLRNVYLEQLGAFGERERDPAGRVISVAYYALINTEKYKEVEHSSYTARWFDIDRIPELVFDHNEMVKHALLRLREKSRSQPIGFELLPYKFTIPQLQKLYEAIHQRTLDNRNFRKKMLSLGLLRRLEEKDKEGSKKGAFLYRFDKEKYERVSDEGLDFDV